MGKEIRSGFGSYFKDDQEEGRPMRLSASELPPDNILFTNNDRVYCVTYHFFKGLEVKADHYTVQDNGVTFTRLPDQDLKSGDLPEKVKKIFDASVRVNVEYLVENGKLTRIKLE